VKLEPLRPNDLDAALALSTAEAWNQCAADWRRLLTLEPAGCFAAREGSRLVGTVTTFTYGRALAWIGMMVVDPGYRRRGIGVALMRMALDHLRGVGVTSVKLDATPAGRPLYESLGFAPDTEIERWQGAARSATSADSRPANRSSPDALLALDRAAYGLDRSRLLERLVAEGVGEPLVAQPEQAAPHGFALARPGRIATYIGPVVARTAEAAGRLLDGMLARLAGQEVCLDLHRGGLLESDTLAACGLSKRRGLLRMRCGPPNDAGTSQEVCASAGPEFG
jgi:GNAT superfamily N-acetyltransferase